MRLRELQAALASGTLSPREALEQCLARLPSALSCGAFVAVDEAGARRAAARLDPRRRGPLYGVPCAVKDLVDVAGLPTARGRRSARVASADAPLVARLRAAGALIMGKTRTDELGLGTLTPGTRDPRDPRRSVGGSSGGSAVAVALGAVPLAVATDTAGSARIPAAACGVSGLCLAAGHFGGPGVVGLSADFDRLGLIAADAEDLQLAWQALTGTGGPPTTAGPVAVLAPACLGRVAPEWLVATEQAANLLAASCPARTVEILQGPSLVTFGAPRAVVVTADAAVLHSPREAERPAVRRQLEEGARHGDGEVAAARLRLAALGAELRDGIGNGVLVTPTLPAVPPRWDELRGVDDELRAIGHLTRLCAPVNSSGLVAVSLPWGVDPDGRPVAVQVVARSEALALAAATRLSAHAADLPSPPTPGPVTLRPPPGTRNGP